MSRKTAPITSRVGEAFVRLREKALEQSRKDLLETLQTMKEDMSARSTIVAPDLPSTVEGDTELSGAMKDCLDTLWRESAGGGSLDAVTKYHSLDPESQRKVRLALQDKEMREQVLRARTALEDVRLNESEAIETVKSALTKLESMLGQEDLWTIHSEALDAIEKLVDLRRKILGTTDAAMGFTDSVFHVHTTGKDGSTQGMDDAESEIQDPLDRARELALGSAWGLQYKDPRAPWRAIDSIRDLTNAVAYLDNSIEDIAWLAALRCDAKQISPLATDGTSMGEHP